jgi:hypothetical protein
LATILSQINPVHTTQSYLFKVHNNDNANNKITTTTICPSMITAATGQMEINSERKGSQRHEPGPIYICGSSTAESPAAVLSCKP